MCTLFVIRVAEALLICTVAVKKNDIVAMLKSVGKQCLKITWQCTKAQENNNRNNNRKMTYTVCGQKVISDVINQLYSMSVFVFNHQINLVPLQWFVV